MSVIELINQRKPLLVQLVLLCFHAVENIDSCLRIHEFFGVEPVVIVCVEMIDEHSGLVVREVFIEQLDQGDLKRLHSTGLSLEQKKWR